MLSAETERNENNVFVSRSINVAGSLHAQEFLWRFFYSTCYMHACIYLVLSLSLLLVCLSVCVPACDGTHTFSSNLDGPLSQLSTISSQQLTRWRWRRNNGGRCHLQCHLFIQNKNWRTQCHVAQLDLVGHAARQYGPGFLNLKFIFKQNHE